jgi:hypothetical protein
MIYYIYYIYLGGYTVYKIYEYSNILRYCYKTLYYTHFVGTNIYNKIPYIINKEDFIIDDWEVI